MKKAKETEFLMIPRNIASNRKLTYLEKIIYGELYSLCKINGNGYAYPTDRHLCQILGFDVKSRNLIQKHLRKMEELGFIKRKTKHMSDDGTPGTWRKIYLPKESF